MLFTIILLFLKGWLIGLLIAAPVGPVGVLCIRRTLHHGWVSGLVTGAGAALADTFYGAIAIFGIVLVSDFILDNQFTLKIIGGLVLLALGGQIVLERRPAVSDPKDVEEDESYLQSPIQDFVSSFLVTMTNPGTILAFLAIFAGLGLTSYADKPVSAVIMVSGIFCGALSWWAGLSLIVKTFQHKINRSIQHKINMISGSVIIGFGLLAFGSLLLPAFK